MIFYAIDQRFPSGFTIPGHLDQDYIYHYFYPNQSISWIVGTIERRILNAGLGLHSLDLLRLAAHGNSGFLQLGQGLSAANAGEFSRLARFMLRNSYANGVEIHGCGVGSSTNILGPGSTITSPVCVPGSITMGAFNGPGYRLLHALATAVGRNVTAGLNCQYADNQWRFEGPTLTVNPNGSYGTVS